MPLLTLLIGALLGASLGHSFDAALAGGFIGLVAGLVYRRVAQVARNAGRSAADLDSASAAQADDPFALLDPRVGERLRALERRVASLEATVRIVPVPVASSEPVEGDASTATSAEGRRGEPLADVMGRRACTGKQRRARRRLRQRRPPPVPAYGGRGSPPRAVDAQRAERALEVDHRRQHARARRRRRCSSSASASCSSTRPSTCSVPIEVRLAGVALGGVALLVLGWRLRGRRAGYAMALQGGGVGVLYLTVFAALRLYQLLSPLAAFALLVLDRCAVELPRRAPGFARARALGASPAVSPRRS